MSEVTNAQRDVTIHVGTDMAERYFNFPTPPNVERMQSIVASLLSGDLSIQHISDATEIVDGTTAQILMRVADASDWTAPARVNGEDLKNGTYRTKQEVAIEATRFALTALRAAEELQH